MGLRGSWPYFGSLIHPNVDYVIGVSNAETTAERTFVDRAGVCRDFHDWG